MRYSTYILLMSLSLYPTLAHAHERKIVRRVAGNKETFAGGRAEGCARDTGGGWPWSLQQMLDRTTATATAGRVLLRLYYTRTCIYCVCVYVCVRVLHCNLHMHIRRPLALAMHNALAVAALQYCIIMVA